MTFKYKYKPDEVYVKYTIVSHVFQWANEVLESWGYKCEERDPLVYKRGFLDKNYYWRTPDILNLESISIDNNFCHRHLFLINTLAYKTNYFKVETKKDIEDRIEEVINWMIKRRGDKKLMRELQLRELLK